MNVTRTINLDASTFEEVLQTDTFIDKTLLLRELLKAEDGIKQSYLVTAPRRYGKSVNADMVRSFFSVEVDERGNPKSRSETKNYKMFTSPIPKIPSRKLQITEHVNFTDKHLGKYPVIFINFESSSIDSYERTVSECRFIIHTCYVEHKYLCESRKIAKHERKHCTTWVEAHKTLDETDVLRGFALLSMYLFKHHGSKCVVVVDEYDAMCLSAMLTMEESQLNRVIEFFLSVLDSVAKDNSEYVLFTFITGISHMCTTGFGKLGNVIDYRFLQNKKFFQFYGLTSAEITDLKSRFSIPDDELEYALKYYNGHQFGDQKVVCTWSFMCFLAKQSRGPFCRGSGVFTAVKESTFRSSKVKFWVMKLLSQNDNTLEIPLFGVGQIVDVKNMSENPNVELNDPSLLFNFMQEEGYLTFTHAIENGQRKATVKIPNEEIRTEFYNYLLSYYKNVFTGLNMDLVKECAVLWNNIDFRSETSTKNTLGKICEQLNAIFELVSLERKNQACFHHLLFVILLHTKYKCSSEIACFPGMNMRRVDILLVYEENVVILELKFQQTALKALQQIIDREYCDIFEKNENYVKNVTSYLLLGINMTIDKQISMIALLNNKSLDNQIICN